MLFRSEILQNGHHIEFRDVNFSYTGHGNNITNLNFTLDHGQTLGILGSTGSGKSTIANLIARFYDVSSGSVRIDGVDVRDMKISSLRNLIGRAVDKEDLPRVNETVTEMLENRDQWHDRILKVREEKVFNIGRSGEEAAKYIISRLTNRS